MFTRCCIQLGEALRPKRCQSLSGAPAFLTMMLIVGSAAAQPANQPPAREGTAVPVEITIQTINGEVRCGPPKALLPPLNNLELQVQNRAERPIWFVAPLFFEAANVIHSSGFTMDLTKGGFLAAPQSIVRVQLETPPPGEYYYSCYEPGQVPTPDTSGFLVVAPAAR